MRRNWKHTEAGGGGRAGGRVLVVHHDVQARRAVLAQIAELGFEVVEASTPVEAIWELENGPMDFQAALVARDLGPSDGRDIVRFISLRYPGITRVLFGGDAAAELEPGAIDAALHEMLDVPELKKLFG